MPQGRPCIATAATTRRDNMIAAVTIMTTTNNNNNNNKNNSNNNNNKSKNKNKNKNMLHSIASLSDQYTWTQQSPPLMSPEATMPIFPFSPLLSQALNNERPYIL